MAVYLNHSTAWVDDGGNIHFSDDVWTDEKLAGVFNTSACNQIPNTNKKTRNCGVFLYQLQNFIE